MTPELPDVALREAIAREDWDKAMEIIAAHTLTVHRALEAGPPSDMDRAAWEALVEKQREFSAEIAVRKAGVGQLIERLKRHSVGAEAYRRGGL